MQYATARLHNLEQWGLNTHRGRFDYVSQDHLLSEIMNDLYFGILIGNVKLRQGDLIHVTDAAMDEAVLRIDGVYSEEKRVQLSLREVHAFKPAVKAHSEAADPGITVRFKGNRGGKWCILDGEGTVVEKGYETRGEAERRLANMLEAKGKAA